MSEATPDTSVVVAGLSSWHPDHAAALSILTDRPVGVAHVLAESYAVLTRLPGEHRVAADIAWTAVRSVFGNEVITLGGEMLRSLLDRLAMSGVSGGATYDAVVAETARIHDRQLVTLDRRAVRTYEIVGARFTLLA